MIFTSLENKLFYYETNENLIKYINEYLSITPNTTVIKIKCETNSNIAEVLVQHVEFYNRWENEKN